jgi:hypothetical protein
VRRKKDRVGVDWESHQPILPGQLPNEADKQGSVQNFSKALRCQGQACLSIPAVSVFIWEQLIWSVTLEQWVMVSRECFLLHFAASGSTSHLITPGVTVHICDVRWTINSLHSVTWWCLLGLLNDYPGKLINYIVCPHPWHSDYQKTRRDSGEQNLILW